MRATRKPRFIAVQCPWCRADHWLVKPNILTSRALPAVASYVSQADAEADAAQRSARKGGS